jgi:hypothetical protein
MDTGTVNRLVETIASLRELRERFASAGAGASVSQIDRMIELAERQMTQYASWRPGGGRIACVDDIFPIDR